MGYLILLTTLVMTISVAVLTIATTRLALGDRHMIRDELVLIKYSGPTLLVSMLVLTTLL